MSSFLEVIWAHIDNERKYILILGNGQTQGLDDTMLTVESQYSINFSRSNRKLCLGFHYNGSNSILFINATKIFQFKARDSEIKKYRFYLVNTSRDFLTNKIKKKKKTGLNGCIYNVWVY